MGAIWTLSTSPEGAICRSRNAFCGRIPTSYANIDSSSGRMSHIVAHSTTNRPTEPPNSSSIERRPGGEIHFPPFILKFI